MIDSIINEKDNVESAEVTQTGNIIQIRYLHQCSAFSDNLKLSYEFYVVTKDSMTLDTMQNRNQLVAAYIDYVKLSKRIEKCGWF